MKSTCKLKSNSAKPLLLAGKWHRCEQSIAVRGPEAGDFLADVSLADTNLCNQAILAADLARAECQAESAEIRSRRLTEIADAISLRADEFAAVIRDEAGKPQQYAEGEVQRAIVTFRLCAAAALSLDNHHVASFSNKTAFLKRFPVGVCSFITPFNFPLNLVAHKVGPAIAAGCPFVLKPAEKTPLSALLLAEVLMEINSKLIPHSWSVLPCLPEQSGPLITHKSVRHLSFTGSAEVGWKLKALAAHARVTLELGGNAAAIVAPDWELDDAVSSTFTAAFAYSGQICISLQRLFVPENCFDDFCNSLIEKVAQLHSGNLSDPTTNFGPMINQAAAQRAEDWINEALSGGAQLHCGGQRSGNFLSPTIISNVPENCNLWQEEVFAPILIISPWSDFTATIDSINKSKYGLQSAIYTHEQALIDQAFNQLEVGQLIVGGPTTFRCDDMPYGGVKASGCGREGVGWAIESMQDLKTLIKA